MSTALIYAAYETALVLDTIRQVSGAVLPLKLAEPLGPAHDSNVDWPLAVGAGVEPAMGLRRVVNSHVLSPSSSPTMKPGASACALAPVTNPEDTPRGVKAPSDCQ
jgi:hypothetical protein